MLNLPDFNHKKIVFIDTSAHEGEYSLAVRAHTFCHLVDGKAVAKTPFSQMFAIFVVGTCSFTTPLIRACKRHGVSIFWLSQSYRLDGCAMADAEGNYLLRQIQYTASPERELDLSRNILRSKLTSQSRMLKKYGHLDAYDRLCNFKRSIDVTKSTSELMGIEGQTAKIYFLAIFSQHGWLERTPRSKVDITNFLMDMGYTYLLNFVDALLRAYGFDTYKGVYHKLFFKRRSLSCDLMEPFRSIIDHAILRAYSLKIINPKDFGFKDGAFYLKQNKDCSRKYSKIFLEALAAERQNIFLYIQGFYRHLSNPTQFKYPTYLYPTRTS